MFKQFPKTREPLPREYQAIYEEHYKANRSGDGAANNLSQKMERWLHHKIANDTNGLSGRKTLEIGAGTLNQLSFESDFSHYDIIEPFSILYQDSKHLDSINKVYGDIIEVAEEYEMGGGSRAFFNSL